MSRSRGPDFGELDTDPGWLPGSRPV